MQATGPVRAEDRISSLDTVRGFALLGILLMNIVGFGLAGAYDDPTNSGGATGINLWTWIVMHILAEGKMRCLFSMIFGAGIILLTGRGDRRTDSLSSADIYYRSIVCSTIFCGYGFAMFGRLERHQLYYIVFTIWIVQLIISPIWLRHFYFGPAEWAWRSLTYWQKQPMRKAFALLPTKS